MDRVAVFVDAGYLFAQASIALSGQKLPRRGLILDAKGAIEALGALAPRLAGVPLLRIYWYDGTSTGPTPQHLTLAHLDNVKLRLGFVNSVGEQKGVDSLIVTDIIDLARNRAMSDAVLLSGDEDLRVGVQQAQEFGVRVHLIGIKPSRGSQSLFLMQEADTTHEWTPDDLSFLAVNTSASGDNQPGSNEVGTSLTPVAAAASQPIAARSKAAGDDGLLLEVGEQAASNVSESDLEVLVATIRQSGQTPREIDGKLLGISKTRLAVQLLSPAQKKIVRDAFLTACERRLRRS